MSILGSAASATSQANAQLAQQVQLAVAGKVQDAAKAEGEAVVKLMQEAAAVATPKSKGQRTGQLIDFLG